MAARCVSRCLLERARARGPRNEAIRPTVTGILGDLHSPAQQRVVASHPPSRHQPLSDAMPPASPDSSKAAPGTTPLTPFSPGRGSFLPSSLLSPLLSVRSSMISRVSLERHGTNGMLWTVGEAHPAAATALGDALSQCRVARRGFASGPLHQAEAEEVEGARYLTRVRTGEGGKHTFYSDLAYGDGEGDTAPAPMDYAVSSVALCTTMTIRLYAERKGWGVRRIKVEVKEDRTKGAGHIPDGLILTIHLDGDLTEEQRQRLLEIAGKCPVKSVMLGKMPKGVISELAP